MAGNKKTGLGTESRLLTDVLQEAGEVAMRFFSRDPVVRQKSDSTPVTEADFAVDRHIRRRLLGGFPDDGWISEESVRQASGDQGRAWIVDPIDGTRAFVRERDDWCISIALVQSGCPILAGILHVTKGDLYLAQAGGGTTLNGQLVAVSKTTRVNGAKIVAYQHALGREEWPRSWPELQYRKLNSMALRLASVASGENDAVVTLSRKSDWDLAAGDLLVQEAGGNITDFAGRRFIYGGEVLRKPNIVAAGKPLHSALLDRTAEWPVEDDGD